jgi:pyrophosphatase PpaX
MTEACIFDIGGVLIRTEDALRYAVRDSMLRNNLQPPPDKQIFSFFGMSNLLVVESSVALSHKGNNLQNIAEKCFKSFTEIYPEKLLDKHRLITGVGECLRELNARGIKTACQTGMTSREARSLLQHFNLLRYFPVIVTLDDVKKPRPDPEAMYLILKKLNIADKSKCLYVGDTVKDVQFARNAGVKIACVTTGPQPKELLMKEKPDYLISNLSELLKLI